MRKNKVLLKRAASLFTALVMLAGSSTYAQEEQTTQEVLSQEMLSETVNGTDPEILELTSETITESIEEQTQEAVSESTQEQTQEAESESAQEQTQETESENLPELVQESSSEDETTECSTDAFVDSTDEDMDIRIHIFIS